MRQKLYKDCSEINASYLTMLVHDVRSGCWWHGSIPLQSCCATDCGRETVSQIVIWHRCVYETKVCSSVPPMGKSDTRLQTLMVAECFWRLNSVCQYSELEGHIMSYGYDFKLVFYNWKFTLSNSVIVHFLYDIFYENK